MNAFFGWQASLHCFSGRADDFFAKKKVTISAYEFLKKFPDERAARLHIEERRWNGAPVCPHYGEVRRIQTRKAEGYYRCLACKTDFTVRTGTIFERSHVPLDKWLYAIYLLVAQGRVVAPVVQGDRRHAEDGVVHSPASA